jgi:MFS family permease
VVAAAFCILFLSAVGSSIIGVMVKPMIAEFGWSRGATTSAVMLNMAFYALSVIVAGRIYDRHGPRWLIPGGVVFFAAGFALMSTMDSLWQFLLCFGVLVGTGQGATTVPMFGSVLGRWFEKWRGLAVSLGFAGYCFGQFILIPVFSDLVASSGWRTTSLVIGGVFLVVGLALSLGVIRGDPAAFGLRPYGAGESSLPAPAGPLTAEAAAGARAGAEAGAIPMPAAAGVRPVTRDLTLPEALRTRSLWLFTFVMFICGGGDHLVATHLVPMVTDYGLSASVAASMYAWLGLLSLAGILIAGVAADRAGAKLPILVTFAVRVALFGLLLGAKGTAPFWVFALGFGLTLLVTAPLTPMLVSALYGVTHIGFISGFITTVHMIGSGLWAYLGGAIYDKTGDYDLAFALAAGLAVVALVCTFFIREERHAPREVTIS